MDSRLRGNDKIENESDVTNNGSDMTKNRKVVFLDRDGVIHEDRSDYVKNVSELKVFSCVPNSIRRLNGAGFEVIVISNQQGVGLELMSMDDLVAIQQEIDRQVSAVGGKISAYYYCTHLANTNCDCRKPKPGLLIQAAQERNIDLSGAYMVGDTERDLIAGKDAGCKTILALSGKLSLSDIENLACRPDFIADDLAKAVDIIIECEL